MSIRMPKLSVVCGPSKKHGVHQLAPDRFYGTESGGLQKATVCSTKTNDRQAIESQKRLKVDGRGHECIVSGGTRPGLLRSGFGIVPPNTFGMVQQRNATALKPMLLERVRTARQDTRLCVLPLGSGDASMVRRAL